MEIGQIELFVVNRINPVFRPNLSSEYRWVARIAIDGALSIVVRGAHRHDLDIKTRLRLTVSQDKSSSFLKILSEESIKTVPRD